MNIINNTEKGILKEIKAKPEIHLILVWIDVSDGMIVGTGSLIVEKKFSHNLGKVFNFDKNKNV